MANFNFNKVILAGRLTAAPELKTTPNGTKVTSFSIAVQRSYKDNSGTYPTDFINCIAWRNAAEFISNYFHKGSSICIIGSIQTRSYEDKNGNKRTAVEVEVKETKFVDSRNESGGTASVNASESFMEFEEVSDDELPF